MLLLWAVGLWFDLIDVVLCDVRVNARECSIRAARDQITHRDEKGSLGACCWSSLSVLYLPLCTPLLMRAGVLQSLAPTLIKQ